MSWSGPLCIHLIRDSLCFLDLRVYFLHQIREVFFHYFSNKFSISCSFSFPSSTPMTQVLICLKLSQKLLSLSSFFLCFFVLNYFFSFCSNWMSRFSLFSKSLISLLDSSTPLLIPCKFFFILLCKLHFCLGLFYAVDIPSEFFEHTNNMCFELCIW